MQSKKIQKSHNTEKYSSEKHQRGILSCFRGSGRRCFCFGRGSGVLSMFWTSVVQVEVNKKGLYLSKKIPTVIVGLIFY